MDSIVFGAAGFVGRSLVAELLRRGHEVGAAVRTDRLSPWLSGQGIALDGLTVFETDLTRPDLGLASERELAGVRDVYNCAARFAFGLSRAEARAVNVAGALNVLEWAAALPGLRRLVHISGYRVSGQEALDYRELGAYEASKREADAAVRARAGQLGVPLTVANPATVIGPGQYLGLAAMVSDLWHGRLPALPGGREVFVPVVGIDYFAAFLAELPRHDETSGQAYWVLDDRTPVLPELIGLLAGHLGVRAPRRTIPVGVLRRLPRALTRADPETLSFLSADRYDTGPARAFAEGAGLVMPPVEDVLTDWADDLVAARFGAAVPPRKPYGYQQVAGAATWVVGEREEPGQVVLQNHAEQLDGPVLAADLPGLGRSGPLGHPSDKTADGWPGSRRLAEWLGELLRPARTRPAIVAHSLACGPAIHYAAAHPDRVARLVLVAPFEPPSIQGMYGRARARRLAAAVRDSRGERDELRRILGRVAVPVEIV